MQQPLSVNPRVQTVLPLSVEERWPATELVRDLSDALGDRIKWPKLERALVTNLPLFNVFTTPDVLQQMLQNRPVGLLNLILAHPALREFWDQNGLVWQLLFINLMHKQLRPVVLHNYARLALMHHRTWLEWHSLLPADRYDVWWASAERQPGPLEYISFEELADCYKSSHLLYSPNTLRTLFFKQHQTDNDDDNGDKKKETMSWWDFLFTPSITPGQEQDDTKWENAIVQYNHLLRMLVHLTARLHYIDRHLQTTKWARYDDGHNNPVAELLQGGENARCVRFFDDALYVVQRKDSKQLSLAPVSVLLGVIQKVAVKLNQYTLKEKPPAVQRHLTSNIVVPEVDVTLELVQQFQMAKKEVDALLAYLQAMPEGEEPPALVYERDNKQDMQLYERELFALHPWSLYNTPQKQKALLLSELRRMRQKYGEEEIREKYSHYAPLTDICAHCLMNEPEHLDTLLSVAFCNQACLKQYYDAHDVDLTPLLESV
jgi:hypothetical protein